MFHRVKTPYTLWYVTAVNMLRSATIVEENDPLLIKRVLRDSNGIQWHPNDLHSTKELALQTALAYCTLQLERIDLTPYGRDKLLESETAMKALLDEVTSV